MKQLFKKKKEKGVSAVIGTILMVAITVVTATAVFMYVGGYFTNTPSKPQSLLLSEKNIYGAGYTTLTAQFTVTQGSVTTPFMIKIINMNTGQLTVYYTVSTIPVSKKPFTNATTSSSSTFTIPGTTSGSTVTITPKVTIYDNNNNGKLDSGDSIVLTLTGSTAINVNALDQFAFEITTTSGSVLYTYQFDF